jgi:hypothetical protein
VPQQALFLMNSPFLAEASEALAGRPEVAGAAEPGARVEALYRIALGRAPTPAEREAAVEYVQRPEQWAELAQVLLLSNEFSFLD